MKITTEKAVFIKTFKSLRADGHAIRTIFSLTERGVVCIERRIASTELNDGFIEIRRFRNLILQKQKMVFKLASFVDIANVVAENINKLDSSKILDINEVIYKPNEKHKTILTV
jgi:hypothetical protein